MSCDGNDDSDCDTLYEETNVYDPDTIPQFGEGSVYDDDTDEDTSEEKHDYEKIDDDAIEDLGRMIKAHDNVQLPKAVKSPKHTISFKRLFTRIKSKFDPGADKGDDNDGHSAGGKEGKKDKKGKTKKKKKKDEDDMVIGSPVLVPRRNRFHSYLVTKPIQNADDSINGNLSPEAGNTNLVCEDHEVESATEETTERESAISLIYEEPYQFQEFKNQGESKRRPSSGSSSVADDEGEADTDDYLEPTQQKLKQDYLDMKQPNENSTKPTQKPYQQTSNESGRTNAIRQLQKQQADVRSKPELPEKPPLGPRTELLSKPLLQCRQDLLATKTKPYFSSENDLTKYRKQQSPLQQHQQKGDKNSQADAAQPISESSLYDDGSSWRHEEKKRNSTPEIPPKLFDFTSTEGFFDNDIDQSLQSSANGETPGSMSESGDKHSSNRIIETKKDKSASTAVPTPSEVPNKVLTGSGESRIRLQIKEFEKSKESKSEDIRKRFRNETENNNSDRKANPSIGTGENKAVDKNTRKEKVEVTEGRTSVPKPTTPLLTKTAVVEGKIRSNPLKPNKDAPSLHNEITATVPDTNHKDNKNKNESAESLKASSNETAEKLINDEEVAKRMQHLKISDICNVLKSLKIEKYVEVFQDEQISGEILMDLTADVLQQELGMSRLHAIKLMAFVKKGHIPR